MKTKDQLIIEKQDELVDWLETECQSSETADLSHSFAESLMIRLAEISYIESELAALKEQPEKPVFNEQYLNKCIEKAMPNLSEIKDVDKDLNEIRGIEPEINIPLVREKIIELLKKKIQNLIVSDLISPLYWEDFADELIKDLQLTDINTPFLGNSGAVIPKTGYLTHSDKWKV